MPNTTSTSDSTVTYTYNPDGSYVETVVSTDAQGAVTTKVYSVNAQGQLLTENVTNPDRSTDQLTYTYLPNGGYQQVAENHVNVDGSRSDVTYLYGPGGDLQQTITRVIATDGSEVDTATSPNSDGASFETVTVMASNGQVTSTTNSLLDDQGRVFDKVVTTPTGTDHAQYQYFPYFPDSGDYQQVTENIVNFDGTRANVTSYYNPDGSLQRVSKEADAADGSRVLTSIDYNPGNTNETVAVIAASGMTTSITNTATDFEGRLIFKDVSTPGVADDRTQYQYVGNSNTTQQVTENVINADGSRSDTTSWYNPDGTNLQTVKDAIAVDGSAVDTTINYQFGGYGAYQETQTATSASGQLLSTTSTDVDSLGRVVYKAVSTPAGTDTTQYQYNQNGEHYQQVTENVVNADGSRSDMLAFYNTDGTYNTVSKEAIAADGSRVDTSISYWGTGHINQETVTDTSATGQVTSTTSTYFDPQGQSLGEAVSTPAGSRDSIIQYYANGNYWQIMENASNADGSHSDATYHYNMDGTYSAIEKNAYGADGSSVNTIISYNPDGSSIETDTAMANGQITGTTSILADTQARVLVKNVSNSAGTDDTENQYFANGGYQQVTENITHADGSGTNSSYSYNWDGTYHHVEKDLIAADGSQVDTTIAYNPDGSYEETVTSYDASHQWLGQTASTVPVDGATYAYNADGSYVETVISTGTQGVSTTKVYSVNAQGQLTSESVTNADGSTSQQSYAYAPNGSYQQVTENVANADGTRSDASYTYNTDGSLQQTTKDAVASDGSKVTTTIGYNSDQSYYDRVTAISANGQVTATTSSDFNAQGQLVFKDVYAASGTDDATQYQYFANHGGYQSVIENVNDADGSHSDSTTSYNSDGSTAELVKHVTAADGSRVDTTINYNSDLSYQEGVTAINNHGQVTSTTTSFVNGQGQLMFTDVGTPAGTDDRTQYQYAANSASYQSVDEQIVNADGSYSDVDTTYNPDGTVAQIVKDATAVGGSRVDTTINYNADRSYQERVIDSSAAGVIPSTTNSSFNWQGQLMVEDVNTATTDDHTQYQYFQNSPRVQQVMESVTNADDSHTDSTTLYNMDGTYAQIVKDAAAVDGSRVDTTINYNSDQSYQKTVTAFDSHGQVTSTTNSSFNWLGQLVNKDVSTPAGTDDRTQYYYSSNGPSANFSDLQQAIETITYADGSRSDSNTAYNPDGTVMQIWKDAIAADGSRVDTTITYNPSGYQETDTATGANGRVTSTTDIMANARGQILDKHVTTATGTDDTQYQYSPANGAYQQITENVINTDGSHSIAAYLYNWDGTHRTSIKQAFAADGSQVDTTANYNVDGSYQETVTSTNPSGQQLDQNTYTVSLNGSYTDSWASQDGSHGSYAWDSAHSEYQASWYDSNGTFWFDDYRFVAGGSPQSGGSFLETYSASDGSSGRREYDASTGIASINWDSNATGNLSGTSQTAAGFIGLQNEGELTNTQSDLTFFNPAVSPGFNAFLMSAEPHA